MKFYAGIGSRKTPLGICGLMTRIARRLDTDGYVLRTGGSDGADDAFRAGPVLHPSELHLPWSGFNGHGICSTDYPSEMAFRIAERLHPNWNSLSHGGRALHGRNIHIIDGPEIDISPRVEFVLCWTPDGTTGKTTAATGGTGEAIRRAHELEIPVYNLKRAEHLERWTKYEAKGLSLKDLLDTL